MKNDPPDCIGDGGYYQIGSLSSSAVGIELDSMLPGPGTDSVDTAVVDSREEIRFHPETGEAYCITAIVHELKNPDWCTCIQAAWDLGAKGDVEGILPLIEALKDDHRQVRDRAHEALLALEASGEPLPVRVLLCGTVDDRTRTDILLGMERARIMRGPIFGFGAVREYCKNVLEEPGTSVLSSEEKAVLAKLKRAAAAVIADLSRRADSKVLLRAGDAAAGHHSEQLLRGAEHKDRPGEGEKLLRAVDGEGDTRL